MLNIALGSAWLLGGIVVTVLTYSSASGGGRSLIAYGAIASGALQLLVGVIQLVGRPSEG